MPPPTLTQVEVALRACWGPETAHATEAYMVRGAGHPARGQCGTTALVVQELLGGELMMADLEHAGRPEGAHYWNVLPDGAEIDLTRDQLRADEHLVNARPVDGTRKATSPGEAAFQVLRTRVALALEQRPGERTPATD